MKQSAKKLFSLALALAMTLTLFTASLTVNAEEKELGTVKVIVKNETFSTADSAPWEGVLIDGEVKLQNDSSMMSVVEQAMTEKKQATALITTIILQPSTVCPSMPQTVPAAG